MKFNLGTFNVRGLTHVKKQKRLCADLESYHLDIVCFKRQKFEKASLRLSNSTDYCASNPIQKTMGVAFLLARSGLILYIVHGKLVIESVCYK